MERSMPHPRAVRSGLVVLVTLAAPLAAPRPASAISVVSASREHSAEVALGGGIWDGSSCVSSGVGVDPDCQQQALASGAADTTLPILDTALTSVSSYPDADNVEGRASASLTASFPPRIPGLFGVQQSVSVGGRDAAPGGFFTTLDASATATSTIVLDTSLSLGPSQWLELTASLDTTHDGIAASVFTGSYEVVDLETGATLASLALGSMGPVTLDISALVGHQIQASFSGAVGLSLPAGFAGGAGPLEDRDFFHFVRGSLALQVVPEPAPAALVGTGLALLTAGRRRRSNARTGRPR
jgi:hypothetical protein